METTTFGDFILEYVNSHSISLNKFATTVGTSHTTLYRWIDGRAEPSLRQLAKLSRATATDICALVYMLYPDTRPTRSAEMQRLADDIGKLPPQMQELVDSLIVGMVVKQSNDNASKS